MPQKVRFVRNMNELIGAGRFELPSPRGTLFARGLTSTEMLFYMVRPTDSDAS